MGVITRMKDTVTDAKRTLGLQGVENGVKLILSGLGTAFGLDVRDANFQDTPKRVARAYEEIFAGVDKTEEQVQEVLSATFPCESDQMIMVSGVRVFSVCPHHLLPVDYEVSAAYLPSPEHGHVVGLSKLSRLIEILARRPVLQEQFVNDVTSYLMTLKGCRGSACFARGKHYCMLMRGARQANVVTTTSSVQGKFMTEPHARAEFLDLARSI